MALVARTKATSVRPGASGEEALTLFKGGLKNYKGLVTDVNSKGRMSACPEFYGLKNKGVVNAVRSKEYHGRLCGQKNSRHDHNGPRLDIGCCCDRGAVHYRKLRSGYQG